VDVHATLRTAVKMTDLAVKFRATVVLDLEPVPRVQGQDTQLGQVFMNLIMNAAQAMPAGQKDHNTITLHARTVQGAVEVVIEDTGCGIPPHLLDRVFDPFFTTKTGGEGMGLGLAICHRIVVDMGGHISVESSMGKGTRVIVRLPGLAVEEAAPAPCALPETSLKARNVWVVDDETLVGRALQRLLKGHQVTVFTRAEEALDHVQDSPRPDLILCDVTMPQMDGPQFFSALKQSRPSLCDCVVFMSGGVDSLQTRAVLKETGRPFLEKPLETARLLSVLDSVAHAA
jgi:CheY-like chemotaxis protein